MTKEELSLGRRCDMTAVKIIVISFVGLLVGAAILLGIVSGPLAVLAAPLRAVFGWFYIFPILLGVSSLWALYQPKRNRPFEPWGLVALGGVGASVLTMVLGVRGPEPVWLVAYAVGGFVAGSVCAVMVVVLKKKEGTG
jgi:hypothetical protein